MFADGSSRDEAERIAAEISKFPETCMRNDRLSALEQDGLSLEGAIQNEFRLGSDSLASPELIAAVEDFIKGRGRHGSFS